jgi:hypothetical protein
MVTVVLAVTPEVVTAKVVFELPAATVTLTGTWATLVLLLESPTTTPPVGAAPVRVTVPDDEPPPIRDVGFSVSEEMEGGVTVNTADRVAP